MKFNRNVYQTLTLITQFGINMLVSIFICSFIGIFIDNKLGTSFFVIIFFVLGAVSGGYNVFRLSKKHLKKDDPYAAYRHGSGFYEKNRDDSRNED